MEERTCKKCNALIADDAKFCGFCGEKTYEEAELSYETTLFPDVSDDGVFIPDMPKKPKNKWKTIICGIVVASVLVCAAFIGWRVMTAPVNSIVKATMNTAACGNYTSIVIVNGERSIVYTDIDWKKREMTQVTVDEDGEIVKAVYDGYEIYWLDNSYHAKDATEYIEEYFENYDEIKSTKLSGEYIVELIEEQTELPEDEVDKKGLEKSIDKLLINLNRTSWLKENAGYKRSSKNGYTIHTFKPDLQELLIAVTEDMKDAFLDEDEYEEALENIEDADSDDIPDCKIKFKIKDSYLIGMTADIAGESIELKIEDIGKTSIDYDMLDEILEEAIAVKAPKDTV